jgi:5-methylcytosine-specific restriction endonuclease McrA
MENVIIKSTTHRTIRFDGLTTNLSIFYTGKALAGNSRFPMRRCFGSAEKITARAFPFGETMPEKREYKTTEKQRESAKKYYQKNLEKFQEYKRNQMARRRKDPIIAEKIRTQTRKWYKESDRPVKQKEYLTNLRETRFFKWRAMLFFTHNKVRYSEADFKAIWDKQNGLCPLTGRKLTQSAHLDHIIPVKKGGSHDLQNLRWVCKEVNYAKRDLTDSEFFELVADIYSENKNVIEAIILQMLEKGCLN